METITLDLANVQMALGELVWLALIFICSFMLRDLATEFAAGLSFYLDPKFKETDQVYLDGEKATIVKIGFRYSVFQIHKNDCVTWRYIQNSLVKRSKLEKVISKDNTN